MSAFTLSKQTDSNYSLEGDITFFTLNKKTINAFDFSNSAEEICIDLANISSSDSAGLALLIEWIKRGKLNGTKLTFKNIPQQLLTLAKLSGIEIDELFH